MTLGTFGCDVITGFKTQEAKLKPLVERRASKHKVVQVLGDKFIYSSKGTPSWKTLDQFLANEPADRLKKVREGAARWENVMFYSTPYMTTWIFLDEQERVVDFELGTQ